MSPAKSSQPAPSRSTPSAALSSRLAGMALAERKEPSLPSGLSNAHLMEDDEPVIVSPSAADMQATAAGKLDSSSIVLAAHRARAEHHGTGLSGIDATGDSRCHVQRTYRSQMIGVPNTQLQAADGIAYSFWISYDAKQPSPVNRNVFKIMAGSPYGGTPLAVSIPDYSLEALCLDTVFRHRTLKKVTMHMVTKPQQVTVGNLVYYNSDLKTPVEFDTSGHDAGVVYIFPWSGAPGVADYVSGLPASSIPITYDRMPEALKFPLQAPHPRIHSLTIRPFQIDIDPYDGDTPSSGFQQQTFTPRPILPMDTQWYRQELEDQSAYGFGIFWYHPELNNANVKSGQFNLEFYFEFEFEWWGLRVVGAIPAPPLSTDQSDSGVFDLEAMSLAVKPNPVFNPDTGEYSFSAEAFAEAKAAYESSRADYQRALEAAHLAIVSPPTRPPSPSP